LPVREDPRVHRTLRGKRRQGHRSRESARRHQGPWLRATALRDRSPAQICKRYCCRTPIEGNFRDLKHTQWGLRLRVSDTRPGAPAACIACLVGPAATAMNLARDCRASKSKRRVLSWVYLGPEMRCDGFTDITRPRLHQLPAEPNTLIQQAAL